MESLIQVLMRRDNLSRGDARDLILSAREEVLDGDSDPEDILRDNFGLEPDYVMDLLDAEGMEGWYE